MQKEEECSQDIQHAQAEVNKRDRNSCEERENFIAPRKARKRTTHSPSDREEEAYSILKKSCERDDCSVYGEYVANELRNLNPRARTIVKHIINNTLFHAGMGKYDESSSSRASFESSAPNRANTHFQSYESNTCGTVLNSGTDNNNMSTETTTPSSTPHDSNCSYNILTSETSASAFCQSLQSAHHSEKLYSFPVLSEFLTSPSENSGSNV